MPGSIPGSEVFGPAHREDEGTKWVVMRRSVELVQADDGEEASLELDAPPRSSCLAVRRTVLPKIGRNQAFGFIECLDDTGLILFSSKQRGAVEMHYLVSDIRDGSVILLPTVPTSLPRPSSASMGVLRDPRHGNHGFVVAQLHPTAQRLLCFSSKKKSWSLKGISTSSSEREQMSRMQLDLVFAHASLLMFVDLRLGLAVIDPFAEGAASRFIELPIASDRVDSNARCDDDIGHRRCLMPSCGGLVYVLVHNGSQVPKISTWVLLDPVDGWSPQHTIHLSDIKAMVSDELAWMVPGDLPLPAIGVVHPSCHSVVYFFQGDSLVGVDLEKRKVLESDVFYVPGMGNSGKTSLYVWAWVPPPITPRAVVQIGTLNRAQRFRKIAKLAVTYVREHPDKVLKVAGAMVEKDGMVFMPVQWRPFTDAIATGLKEAGRYLESNDLGRMLREQADGLEGFSGTALEIRHVRTKDEALKLISTWKDMGEPDNAFGVKFPDDLCDEDIRALCEFFEDKGAKCLLLHARDMELDDDPDDGWMFVIA